MKPIRIDTSRFQMLSKERWDCACAMCNTAHSKWEMRGPDKDGKESWAPVCSLCFLYKSNWGKTRAADISAYLAEVIAQETKRKMVLGADGALTNVGDADFILGVLALTSRRFDIEDFAAGARR